MIAQLKFLLVLASLTALGCAQLTKPASAAKEFTINKKWARSTLSKEYLGFRLPHRMEPVIHEGIVIQGNSIDGLVAYDRKSGHMRWRMDFKFGVEAGAQLVGNTLYFGANDAFFYAVDLVTRQLKWRFPAGAQVLGKPLVDNGSVYFVAGDNVAYALDAETGKMHWRYNRREAGSLSIRGGSQPSAVGDTVYLGFSDGALVALERKTGKIKWEKSLAKSKRFSDVDAQPVIEGSRIYVPSYDGALYCLNRTSGEVFWEINHGAYSGVTIAGDKLFYATSDGQVIGADKASGKILWKNKVKSGGLATRPSLYRGLVLYGESGGRLWAVDALSGEMVGSFAPGRGILSSPVIDPSTGEVYVMSADANLFALQLGWKSQADLWPWER